jgi:predicted negative regulator of RcsB-dependent stress response
VATPQKRKAGGTVSANMKKGVAVVLVIVGVIVAWKWYKGQEGAA